MKQMKEFKTIGEMPDELSVMIQDFIRPDMTKIRAKERMDFIIEKIKNKCDLWDLKGSYNDVCKKYYGYEDDDDLEVLYSYTNYRVKNNLFLSFDRAFYNYYMILLNNDILENEAYENHFNEHNYINYLTNEYDDKYDIREIIFNIQTRMDFIEWKLHKNIV